MARENAPFTLEADLGSGWSSDNKERPAEAKRQVRLPGGHALSLRREKRKGKQVTLVGEFFLEKKRLKSLAATLKKKLSTGGSATEGWIELQGDVRTRVKELLEAEGYGFQ